MSKSISQIPETDVDIRFVIFFLFVVKRMSTSVSGICETDFDIRFLFFAIADVDFRFGNS